jgi:orotate phosphoribosyltransferase
VLPQFLPADCQESDLNEAESVLNRLSHSWEHTFAEMNAVWDYADGGLHAQDMGGTKHMDYYFNSNYIVSHPDVLQEICMSVFLPELKARQIEVDWVVTYPPFGVPVALCLAGMLKKARFAYCEKEELRFDVKAGSKALLVADDVYTGKSLDTLIDALSARDVEISDAIMVLGNLSGQADFRGNKIVSAISRSIGQWNKADCPLCKAGSKAIGARSNWQALLDNRRQLAKI